MNKAYLLLGSNMGNSLDQLNTAIKHITRDTGKITHSSSLYATAAWGNTNQPDFLNQVIVVETLLTANEILQSILAIEIRMGRIRTVKNAPRIIYIDILFFNKDIIIEKNLIVPHPEIQNRRFVLIPLNEIEPHLVHPVFNKTVSHLLQECNDALNVKKFYP